jgi:hypothetical protein
MPENYHKPLAVGSRAANVSFLKMSQRPQLAKMAEGWQSQCCPAILKARVRPGYFSRAAAQPDHVRVHYIIGCMYG